MTDNTWDDMVTVGRVVRPHGIRGQVVVAPETDFASERFRAVRLVVDTGMHAMGWSRDRAIEYFHVHAPEASLAEIDRYISWPGQALAYKMGQLKIVELRKQAEAKLGTKFDVRDFHGAVLRDGTLPLELLGEQVGKYIDGATK